MSEDIIAVAITALICTRWFWDRLAVTPGQFNALKNRVAKLESQKRRS
jgi:hypothetical protein